MKKSELNVLLGILLLIILLLVAYIWDSKEILSDFKLGSTAIVGGVGIIIILITLGHDKIQD